MNRSLKSINLVARLANFNPVRTVYDRHLIHPKGKHTIQVEEDDDQKLFACIHLEPTFPYEHTKPIPYEVEAKQSDSVLNYESMKQDIYPTDPSMLEVQRLTYTSDLFWEEKHDFKKTYNKKKLKPRPGP